MDSVVPDRLDQLGLISGSGGPLFFSARSAPFRRTSSRGFRDLPESPSLPSELPFRLQPRPWARLSERARSSSLGPDGSRRVAPFVALVAVAAILATILLATNRSSIPEGSFLLALALVALGFAAEFHSFNQSKEAAGSAALIPFTAAALVAPSFSTV